MGSTDSGGDKINPRAATLDCRFGILLLVGAIVLCYLIERRIAVDPASAVSAEWIGTVWDAKLLLMAATLLLSILGWLTMVIYALFRDR